MTSIVERQGIGGGDNEEIIMEDQSSLAKRSNEEMEGNSALGN